MRFCIQLSEISRICAKGILELNCLNVHGMYSDNHGGARRPCNKKLELPLLKSKLGMQSLSYLKFNTTSVGKLL